MKASTLPFAVYLCLLNVISVNRVDEFTLSFKIIVLVLDIVLGLTSATAKIGKLFVNDDESVLVFKEERGKHMLQKQICFQVKGMCIRHIFMTESLSKIVYT